jgi:hypothetical protein
MRLFPASTKTNFTLANIENPKLKLSSKAKQKMRLENNFFPRATDAFGTLT